MRALSLLLASLLLAVPSRAPAQGLPGEPATRGPEIPAPVLAGDADASAVVLDAANLAFLRAWNLFGFYTHLDDRGARGPGGGGLYFAAPMPLLDRLVLGAGIDLVRPPSTFPYPDTTRLALAASFRLARGLGVGLTYTHVFLSESVEGERGIDTFDLSLSARFGAWGALALVVRDVSSPAFAGLGVERVYEAQFALRPTENAWLELAPTFAIGERRADILAGMRVQSMVYPGVTLRGDVTYRRDEFAGGRKEHDVRATLGVQLDLAPIGVGGYALFGTRNAGGDVWHGFSVTARASGERYPAFFRPARFERVDLASLDERRLAAQLARLARIERDDRVFGVLVVAGGVGGSWATMEELRSALARLREAGKRVFVYAAELDTKSYYVASAAERIYLDPAGGVRFTGSSSTAMFFKGTLDKLPVRAEFVRIAEYKSAPEQFTREGPTPEALAVRNAILDDVDGRVMAAVAEARKLESPARAAALRDAGPYTAAEAQKNGLVDELAGGEEVEDLIGLRLGRRVDAVPPPGNPRRDPAWSLPGVAVIFVDGDIVDGRSRTIPILDQRFVGHETIIRALEQARGDGRVRAIVLRIDSPGGSALASDLIAREVARTARVKPVVCSLGDTAASGGYFIAAPCDAIIASPSTITGSIGIFTGKFDVSGLAERLGVGLSTLRRGPHADMESLFRPYTDEERALILDKLRYFYERFVATVSNGRKMTMAEVDAVGRGHVWTGAQAKEHKLVDRLGGLMDAVREAKKRAGLDERDEIELVSLPEEPTSLLGQLGQLIGLRATEESGLVELLRPIAPLLRALPGSLLLAPSTPQARMF